MDYMTNTMPSRLYFIPSSQGEKLWSPKVLEPRTRGLPVESNAALPPCPCYRHCLKIMKTYAVKEDCVQTKC